MNKKIHTQAFIRRVQDRLSSVYLLHEIQDVLEAILDEIEETWIDRDEIVLTDFGVFSTRVIKGFNVPSFRASISCRQRIKRKIKEYYGE